MAQKSTMRTFYIMALTQAFSALGSLISGLAIAIWVFTETGDATPLALVSFFQILPRVVGYTFAGVIADRFDRRQVIALSDTGQAVGTAVLLIVFATGNFQIWHLYLVTFVQSLFAVLQGPAFMASVPMLVPQEHLNRANALVQLTGPLAAIVAPIITGFIYAPLGVTGAILIDLVTFSVAIVVILRVYFPKIQKDKDAPKQTFWQDFKEGFVFLLDSRPLLAMIFIFAFVNMMASTMNVLSTPYILSRTDSEAALGLIMGVASLGSLLGGIVMMAWGGTKRRIHTIFPAIIVVGAGMVFFGMSQTIVPMIVTIFIALVAISMAGIPLATLLQTKVPLNMQGRVGAFFNQLVQIAQPIAYLMVGPLADNIFEPAINTPQWQPFAPFFGASEGAGMGLMIALSGVGIVVVTMLAYALPYMRQMEERLPTYNNDTESEIADALEESPAMI